MRLSEAMQLSGRPTSRCSAAQAKQAPRQPICVSSTCRERPADRAGEAGDQRDAGDGVARVAAVHPHQRREGRFVQAAAHADADHEPGRDQARSGRCARCRARQAGGEDEVGADQDRPAAAAVDGVPAYGPSSAETSSASENAAKTVGTDDAEVARHRRGEHRRQVVGGGPGQGLGQRRARRPSAPWRSSPWARVQWHRWLDSSFAWSIGDDESRPIRCG